MEILENYDLTKLNTFGVPARARFFAVIETEQDLKELFSNSIFQSNDKLFLGGGSNILFTKDFEGIVLLNKLKGIEILEEDEESVVVRAMGGEVWHDLVLFAVNKGLWGIENLAFIPGTVGAAPMQNIGAYGAEIKNTLQSVEVFDVKTGEKKIFYNEKCCFGYRDSIFKNDAKGKYFVSAITLKLSKKENKNINYKILQEYLLKNNIEVKNSKDVSDAVTAIRKSRLPDPAIIGNAGSFFKNIFIDEERFKNLLAEYPEMPHFNEDGKIKIPAAWLIEQSGPEDGTSWKGKRLGNVGVHERQALVLVNHGGGTGQEVKDLAEQIISSVYNKFGLKLTPEVNLI